MAGTENGSQNRNFGIWNLWHDVCLKYSTMEVTS